ncbi:MAG: acyltransferase [Prevotellaceae bacterium]|nr:acyltransferase [Prevotellaceae bacterium]
MYKETAFHTKPGRPYNSIDHLRCVLIMMVILIHTVNFGNLYPEVKDCINFFFMPAFFLITGYLVNINKLLEESGAFIKYIARIALPYTIMVLGYSILSLYLPVRDGITDSSPATLAKVLFVTSIGPYWFLHTMMVCGTLYYTAFRLLMKYSLGARCILFGSLLLIVALYTPLLSMRSAAFYFAGVSIRLFHGNLTGLIVPRYGGAIPFLLLALSPDYTKYGDLSVAILSISFISFVSALCNRLPSMPSEVVGYIGRNTFPIYLFHPIFTMAAKFMLSLFSFDPTGLLHVSATILLGIAGSLLIAKFLDKTALSYCFGRRYMLR